VSTATTDRPLASTKTALARDDVRQVIDICQAFISDVKDICRGPLMLAERDNDGADIAFTLQVPPEEYEAVVLRTSELEAQYFTDYGINFLVIPEV
jgi:hypothetical protein